MEERVKDRELAQMGSASVALVTHKEYICIRKSNASLVERNFYQVVAPMLVARGVGIPELVDLTEQSLFLEYIPNKVSLAELSSSRDAFAALSAIHRLSHKHIESLKQHSWTDRDTNRALSRLSLPEKSQAMLCEMQKQAQHLFDSDTLISGDSNNGNWGRRDNGELVLFDWERFGYGHPAIDLAPLVKGMGAYSEYLAIAERYVQINSQTDLQDLIRSLILAKAWIAVEVVNILFERQNSMKDKYVDWYNSTLPAWFKQIERYL
ncbi:protein kinase-like protein [Vibrio ishigakensis]|uniref:Protein kinase-like protein n=1 Tax=Vibrio ishigakensis TaxID=1481914 RepID=A0A0B8QDA2_9VIBR|nr:protein kinase-like protein [Vibrio ishigakensis]